jgi:hypothetical protein
VNFPVMFVGSYFSCTSNSFALTLFLKLLLDAYIKNYYMLENLSLCYYAMTHFLVTFQAPALQLSYVVSPKFPLISVSMIYFLHFCF